MGVLRWDCSKNIIAHAAKCASRAGLKWDDKYSGLLAGAISQGCFNSAHRPRLEVFDNCFPGNISIGDVDGIVEKSGNILLIEFKSYAGELSIGQRLLYEAFASKPGCCVVVCDASVSTMTIRHICVRHNGDWSGWINCDLQSLQRLIAAWCAWARRNPCP